MKNKNVIILGILVVAAIVVIAIIVFISSNRGNNNMENMEIMNIINNNSKLPVKYMSKYDSADTNLNKYDKLNNFMSNDYKNKDISFRYYGYPNDESEYYLGEIVLLTNKYNILGVTIGDNMKQSISKIEKYGFKLEERNNYFVATLNYKDFTIEIDADTDNYDEEEDKVIIGAIKLKAKSEYLGNRVY